MDPCPFIRLTISNLALKLQIPTKPPRNLIHPSNSSQSYCKIKLKHFPPQTATIPYVTSSSDTSNNNVIAALFHLDQHTLGKITKKRRFISDKLQLKIYIYSGVNTCGGNSGRLLGKVVVPLDGLKEAETRGVVFCNGWSSVGKEGLVRVNVRADPDPRFVFEFDGDPECSPQVFQIQGSVRQPVFSCKFSFRQTAVGDRHHRTRSLQEQGSGKGWLHSFGSEKEKQGKERKGWSVTVHDLSGSPVAAASMSTPFVASPGSDRVSRSNPGSWLILRPGEGTWKPWGRLEAWRERGNADGVGYKFELIPDITSNAGVVLAESTLSTSKGGKFIIDLASPQNFTNTNTNINCTVNGDVNVNSGGTPRHVKRSSSSSGCSPRGRGSGDFGSWLWPYTAYRGFVMAASVEGEGKCSKPTVEVSVQHVSCSEDAAAFVALAAAIDLSIDACRLFSQKLRKELCQNDDTGC